MQSLYLKKQYLFFSIMLIMLVSMFAQAQEGLVSSDIQFSLHPKYPGPNESVTVRARSDSFDLNTTSVTWLVNGVAVKSGKAISEISITTGSLGSPTTVTMSANPAGLRQYKNTITIWPSTIDVLWYAHTYTHPGYRGKALPVRGSTVTIVALPTLRTSSGTLDTKALFYEWRLENKLLPASSGKGKNTISLPVTQNSLPLRVSVLVHDERSLVSQEKRISITPHIPHILFYELHPLRGPLFQMAIQNIYTLGAGEERQFIASPLFSSGSPRSLNFQWNVDTEKLPPGADKPDILSFSAEQGSSAQKTISLIITNPANIFEEIRKSFRIHVQ